VLFCLELGELETDWDYPGKTQVQIWLAATISSRLGATAYQATSDRNLGPHPSAETSQMWGVIFK